MPVEYTIGRLRGGFAVSWWIDGKRRRFGLAARARKEAEAEAIDIFRRETVKSKGSTIDELWEQYRKEKSGRRVAVAMSFEWRKMKPFFGHLRPDQVTIDLCRSYTGARTKVGKHPGTIWTELGHLRTVLLWAVKRNLITTAPDIERPPKPAPKDRWLTHAEITRLLDAPKAPHIQLAILLMLATAGRVGAVLELTWDRVDFATGVVNLRTTETGPRKGRAAVPMNAGLRAALSAAERARISDYVVEWSGKQVGSIKTGFNAAAIEAGFAATKPNGNAKATISPHTLRHTAAVHLAVGGAPMSRISQYLGHSNTWITERVYARFAPGHLQGEADILDFTRPAKAV